MHYVLSFIENLPKPILNLISIIENLPKPTWNLKSIIENLPKPKWNLKSIIKGARRSTLMPVVKKYSGSYRNLRPAGAEYEINDG